ncbi:MAG TPA: sigma-70 family RNA polymerase sigma factor [Gemmataceae bacterium]|nr:sigma-70 family RNA polymerase sigma factor [Gemmataceae bacterium]
MTAKATFQELMQRVRNRDQDAAAELVRRYESHVRRAVRFQLVDPRLRRIFDSVDVCQSVLATFFQRAAAGQYQLEHADQLVHLLVRMACNKVADQARKQRALRRDVARVKHAECVADEQPGREREPGDQLAQRELVARFRERLSEEEWRLVSDRADGRGWAEIAEEVGGTPEGLRKRLARAVERVERQLNLGESSHD